MIKILRSQKGMTFFEALIGSVVAMMFSLGAGTALNHQKNSAKAQSYNETLEVLSEAYNMQIQDYQAWEVTRAEDSNKLDCIDEVDKGGCKELDDKSPKPELVLKDSDGKNFRGFDGSARSGFDRYGNICASFNQANPDGQCIIRPKVTWEPLPAPGSCSSPPCKQPVRIDVEFELALKTGDNVIINPERFRVSKTIVSEVSLLERRHCNSNEVVTGVDEAGVPICSPTRDIARDPDPCTTVWGATVQHGNSIPAYNVSTVISPRTCPAPISLTCNDGSLSGPAGWASYRYGSCSQRPATVRINRVALTVPRAPGRYTGIRHNSWRYFNLSNYVTGDWRRITIRMEGDPAPYTRCGAANVRRRNVPTRRFNIYKGHGSYQVRNTRHAGCNERLQKDEFRYNGGNTIRAKNSNRCMAGKCGSISGGYRVRLVIESVGY